MEGSSSWMWRITDVYDMLWKMVIRPPRDMYGLEELGPEKFRLGKKIYIRRDLQLMSSRGVLECSHFLPARHPEAQRPCVVYLHGNCSSRLEAFDALPVLLPHDVTVFCLDLSGSGRSDGEYISLGFHEEGDLRAALEHLKSMPGVSSIGLWGRSMGATTSILRASQDRDLAACVLDSAFQDLKTVADELVGKGRFPVPSFLSGWAFDMVRNECINRAGFDPLELSPIKHAPVAACPGFFGVASDDSFVLPHHTQALHDAWGGARHLRVFDGGHNGVRPTWFLEEAAAFLADELRRVGESAARPIDDVHSKEDLRPRLEGYGQEGLRASSRRPSDPAKGDASSARQVNGVRYPEAQQLAEGMQERLQELLSQPAEQVFVSLETGPPAGQRDHGMPLLEPVSEREVEANRYASLSPTFQSSAESARPTSELRIVDNEIKPSPAPVQMEAPKIIPAGLSLAQQLTFLGFAEELAEWASRRSLTLEAAVDTLSTRAEASVSL